MKTTTKKRGFQTQISAALDDLGLPVYEFRLYCHILRRGDCWESVPNMGKHCGIGKDRAWEAIERLLAFGLIRKVAPKRKGQRTHTFIAVQVSEIADTSSVSGVQNTRQQVSGNSDSKPSENQGTKDNPSKDGPSKDSGNQSGKDYASWTQTKK